MNDLDKILRFIDLRAMALDDLFWSLNCYLDEQFEDGMKQQFELLIRLDYLDELYMEFTEEEKDLVESIYNLMVGDSETRTYLCM